MRPLTRSGPGERRGLALAGVALALLVLFAAAAMLESRAISSDRDPPVSGSMSLHVGSLAPDFELNDTQTGKAVRLSSFRGRPVWINFWATWCDDCKLEMPQMQRIYSQRKASGPALLGCYSHLRIVPFALLG